MKGLKLYGMLFFLSTTCYSFQVSHLDSLDKEFYTLTQSLVAKYDSGKISEVKINIQALEKLLPNYRNNWNYTNALHKINIVKGRIALKSGDKAMAKRMLIDAGNVMYYQLDKSNTTMGFASPQLKSFGPNMSLAKELLLIGEKSVVLEYFKICRSIWPGQIDQWTKEVEGGKIPDFGPNLYY